VIVVKLPLVYWTFGDDLVNRTLDERRGDRFAMSAPGGVMDQRSLVPFEIAQQPR
jgi:hypothetical protein